MVLAARAWWWGSLILDIGVRIGGGVLLSMLLLLLLLLLSGGRMGMFLGWERV